MENNDGCGAVLDNGRQVVDTVRVKWFSKGVMDTPHSIECDCGTTFEMTHFEEKCPSCSMVYGVTPCHSHDATNVKAAGIDY